MIPIAIVAAGAVSALGRGKAAYAGGDVGEAALSALRLDPELAAHGVRHPLVGRVAGGLDAGADRAEALLAAALGDVASELDRALPAWRELRVAIVLGTSAGGMPSIEAALAARAAGEPLSRDLARRASYFAPLARVPSWLGVEDVPVRQILAACASSTLAVGFACRWLEARHFDLVLAGGYDALSALVASGFEALGALTRSTPRPFHPERDGFALGEGAAVVALARPGTAGSARGRILGFSATSDAVHVTAPDASGSGLASAAERALADAGVAPGDVDLVSAHATATPYNDQAESRALRRVLGDHAPPVHPFKAVVGHTLGAAGALELLAALDALERSVVPAAKGAGALDPALGLDAVSSAAPLGVALKLSSAFGGANAALVLGRGDGTEAGPPRPARAVALRAAGALVTAADPARVLGWAPGAERWVTRADGVSELVLAAVAALLDALGEPLEPDAALVVGTASATLEVDELFDRRRRDGRPVEPRRFPATSPNLCAGLCSIVFGLRGPSFAVGSGPRVLSEAALFAHDLVAAGDAPSALLVAVEDAGEVVGDLFRTAGYPVPRRGASAALLSAAAGRPLARGVLASHPSGPDPDFSRWFRGLDPLAEPPPG